MTPSHRLSDAVLRAYLHWWHGLHSPQASGGQRAARAQLKRCHDLQAVTLEPAYQALYQQLRAANGGDGWPTYQQDRIAALAALGAHLKEGNELSFPKAASRGAAEGRAALTPLRFRRLLDADDTDTLFLGLRRALPLLGYALNPAQLAQDVFGWGDAVKRRWAYDYAWPSDSKS